MNPPARGNQVAGDPHKRVIGCRIAAICPIQARTRLMSRRITALIASSLLLTALPSLAQGIDPATQKLCSEARDYVGCVKANANAKSSSGDGQKIKAAEIERAAIPNTCPTGYAYSGGGLCRTVLCSWEAGDEPGLAGKAWKCSAGLQKQYLRWGNSVAKATIDSKCPPRQPRIGYQSTCEER